MATVQGVNGFCSSRVVRHNSLRRNYPLHMLCRSKFCPLSRPLYLERRCIRTVHRHIWLIRGLLLSWEYASGSHIGISFIGRLVCIGEPLVTAFPKYMRHHVG